LGITVLPWGVDDDRRDCSLCDTSLYNELLIHVFTSCPVESVMSFCPK
jgi:hypothetical protein